MSLYIALYDGDEEIASMNWLRNPFGLCRWAEDNIGSQDCLWHVCNDWSYGKSVSIDRAKFKLIVDSYWEKISNLNNSYFFFSRTELKQFIEPYTKYPYFNVFPVTSNGGIRGSIECMTVTQIPVDYFNKNMPREIHIKKDDRGISQQYQDWFKCLVDFAELLQNPKYRFECSN